MKGVKEVKASLAKSQVTVEYDPFLVTSAQLEAAIIKLGYEMIKAGDERKKGNSINQLIGVGIIIFALYLLIKSTVGFNFIPQVDKSVGYGMLFVIGLLTSLHCVAMCGGINLSLSIEAPPSGINLFQSTEALPNGINSPQSIAGKETTNRSKLAQLGPSLLYNTGRVISYTLLGGIVGAIGSVISFSGTAKGIVAIAGGIFMVIIGINMLDIFPWLRKIKINMPKFFGNKIYNNTSRWGPFYIGLLNGLMPCGPLQTMQLYALGTGSFLAGATSMFLFSLGTVPLMFSFGAIGSFLSSKFTHRMVKVSAVLVIVLGLTMVSRGLSLSGVSIAAASPISGSTGNVAKIQGGVQVVTTTMESGKYQPFVVQKGIPVRWIIKAKAEDLDGCNNPVTIPQYKIQKKLVPGDNVVEFTPAEGGTITYTCWMGMISSYIKVVPDVSKVSGQDLANNSNNSQQSSLNSGGGCCAASANATKFRGGRIPTDDIQIAKIVNGVQEVNIKVNDQGFSPAAVVLQRGVKAKIKFTTEKLDSCNYLVVFPEYQSQLDLSQGQVETPAIQVTRDFTFQCGMGMLHGYVKVVDDISKINLKAIKNEIEAYRPAGGGGCCGG
ncbi:MAG TPA: heavy metal transporter, partial [Firmicutes bacterium]|nr:heavy metal transporter [Bacillota bacterium]